MLASIFISMQNSWKQLSYPAKYIKLASISCFCVVLRRHKFCIKEATFDYVISGSVFNEGVVREGFLKFFVTILKNYKK